jgi:hypothetical protein
VPIEKTEIVGLGKPAMPKDAVLMRSRAASPESVADGPLSPRWARSSSSTRNSAASAD